MVLCCEVPAYRLLLFIAVGLYLGENFVLGNHAEQPSTQLSKDYDQANGMRIKHVDSITSEKREQIQASIIPKIGPQRHNSRSHPITSRRPEAEVRILVPGRRILPPLDTHQLLRASSILMDFDEDARQYFLPKDHASHQDRRQHRIRHGSHRYASSTKPPDIFHAANDAPLDEPSSMAPPVTRPKPSHTLVKALDYPQQGRVVLPRRKIDGLSKLRPGNDSIWIAFHSPEKIFIPVRYNDEKLISATPAKRGCVQCSANLTLTAARGESTVEVPVPVISICARLARRRGRMNIAVSSGPRPGVRMPEGQYPVQVIAWKKGGNVYSCQYTLTVTVKKCSNVPSLEGGSVECSNDTIWGSKCHFSCSSDYVLQGQRTIECEGNSDKVAWSSAFPVCRKNPAKDAATLRKLPCMKPPLPEHGTVVCNANGKEIYPDGSICQFFCYPGFLIDQLSTTNVLIVCKNSRWTPSASVQCVATYCPEPKPPKDGSMRCSHPEEQETKNIAFKSKYRNGTTCSTRCDIGYVIPTSQLPRSNIVCHAPTWNDSSIPECRRAMPPEQVSGCHNVTVAVGVGQTFEVEVHRLPRFASEKGELLTPNCTLQGKKLPKGVHRNFCEATDKELRVTTVCSYYIEVEERRAPRPYLRDCKNRTLIATRRGTVKLNSPRFVITRSRDSAKTFLHANCTYSGEIIPGTYINFCTAHDEATNSSGSCSYSVTVKERSCQPLPVIPHASLDCDLQLKGLYSPRTTCKYICEEGFTIPKSQRRRRIRRCTPKLIWKPIMEPSCKRVVPPHPVRDACLSQTFILKNNETFMNLKLPKFKSSLKGSKVKVHCSLNKTLPAGNYINVCDAFDTELEVSASCKYNVTIKNVECPLLKPILLGSIKCDSETDSVPRVGALCNYECDEGYVIPTSLLSYTTKLCTYHGRWNSTVTPVCIPDTPPVLKKGSCQNVIVSVEDLSRFNVPQPEFVSSNGVDLDTECDPSNITSYGIHNITCTAFNSQSRASSSCSFQLDVQNPNEETELDREEIGCVELGIVENGIVHCNSTESKILPFKTLCEVSCDEGYVIPASQVHLTLAICEENAEWNVSNIPHCVKATGCVELGIVQNGIVHCNSTESKILPLKTVCEISCDEGYVIPASHRYLTPAICEDDAEWNVSNIPHCVKAESPILYSGCMDQVIQLTELPALDFGLPEYNTVRGTPTNMTCAPDKLTSYGLHKVSCIAKDEELGTYASCSFDITVLKNNEDTISSASIPDDVTTTQITTTEKFLACKSLKLPYRGILNCSNQDGPERCTVGCENGYGFSSSYRALRGGLIECDGTDGLWDFERIYHTTQLPECLGHLPNTSIRVTLSFKAAVEECSSDREVHYHQTIKHLLLSLNREMCSLVDCESSIQVNCSQANTGNRFILNIIWTLLAVFNPEDYEDSLEVPDAELQLEAILETTRKAIKKDEAFRKNLSQVGIQLQQDSYNRSFIDLVCQANGYAADPRTYKCMECASGTVEVNGQCKPCPRGTFQLRAGQTNCERCPSDSVKFFRGNVPATCGG